MNNTENSKTSRTLVTEILASVHPELDFTDEDTLFSIIYDDYEEYARVLEERDRDISIAEKAAELRGRNAAIEEGLIPPPIGDGIPSLGGTNIPADIPSASIFDIALNKFEI